MNEVFNNDIDLFTFDSIPTQQGCLARIEHKILCKLSYAYLGFVHNFEKITTNRYIKPISMAMGLSLTLIKYFDFMSEPLQSVNRQKIVDDITFGVARVPEYLAITALILSFSAIGFKLLKIDDRPPNMESNTECSTCLKIAKIRNSGEKSINKGFSGFILKSHNDNHFFHMTISTPFYEELFFRVVLIGGLSLLMNSTINSASSLFYSQSANLDSMDHLQYERKTKMMITEISRIVSSVLFGLGHISKSRIKGLAMAILSYYLFSQIYLEKGFIASLAFHSTILSTLTIVCNIITPGFFTDLKGKAISCCSKKEGVKVASSNVPRIKRIPVVDASP